LPACHGNDVEAPLAAVGALLAGNSRSRRARRSPPLRPFAGRLGIPFTDTLCQRDFLLASRSLLDSVETPELTGFTVTAKERRCAGALRITNTDGSGGQPDC
jgi:hypothetical protein